MNLAEIEAAAGNTELLHDMLFEALALRHGGPRDTFLSAIRHHLGSWPFADTPPEEVLRGAGTPGLPVARVLAAEESRPERYQRPELIAELRLWVDGLGPHATALPTTRRR